jgi:hypothetical protein
MQVHVPPTAASPLADGSYLSRLGELTVRIIEADGTCVLVDGPRVGGPYRRATTRLDPTTDPTDQLLRLYSERWEIYRRTSRSATP